MKSIFTTFFFIVLSGFCFGQPIPTDSLYLGQTLPGNTPVIFKLTTGSGLHACERIAISSDGKNIYYGELDTYPPVNNRIKCFNYTDDHWQGPDTVFENHNGPVLSPDDSTAFLQYRYNNFLSTFYSSKTDTGWSTPKLLIALDQNQHYFQQTSLNRYYISSVFPGSNNGDIGYIAITTDDTVAVNIGLPVNSKNSEGDFFIARDESFLIITRDNNTTTDLYISFKRPDGRWTNPKSLGSSINTSEWEYGMFVTLDNKYLFFTRGGSVMSGYYTFWVRVDNIINNLKLTNFEPYLKNPIPDQGDSSGHHFSYTIPDSIFFDDDGIETLTITAKLSNNKDFPDWITYNPNTRTFEGTPTEPTYLSIKVTATDTAGVSVSDVFAIKIEGTTDIAETDMKDKYLVYPNPAQDVLNIQFPNTTSSNFKIFNYTGALVKKGSLDGKECKLDISGLSAGEYVIQILNSNELLYTSQFMKRPF